MATQRTYASAYSGTNTRGLLSFLVERQADIEFIANPKKDGKLFCILRNEGGDEIGRLSCSQNITEEDIQHLELSDLQVSDYKDADGKVWPSVERRGTTNIVRTFSFK